ncbi:hypothetical protein G8759_25055 [Spirosoma aureum]|uniref:Ig-like domain-containing protein n=1 Tax=Spirosoma aureum TaxID=2692134 RepID=A0A6G9ATR0_9BACT|nr:choice-of-anchor Q domain-containing protein [Spirosoma aureum]QIP15665.1 hypothetical protein G8759_25055 [Spirosoma aureum]
MVYYYTSDVYSLRSSTTVGCIILFCLVLLGGLTAQAQRTWTGATSTDWNTAGNWNPANLPTASDDVIIPSAPSRQPILSTAGVAKSVVVNSGASLSITSGGTLTINGATNDGLNNSGIVRQAGTLIIGSSGVTLGGFGILNAGTFTNEASSGVIQIDRATGGIGNASSFTNAGQIRMGTAVPLTQQGIRNRTQLAGITAMFTNAAGGIIQVEQSGVNSIQNDVNSSFINSATITMGASTTSGNAGIFNSGTFTNNTGGEIRADRSSTLGISNVASATMTNSGKLVVGNTASVGTNGIETQGTFTNTAGGEIRVDRGSSGIVLSGTATVTNSGTIVIGAVAGLASSGIGVLGSGRFLNNAGGDIRIDRAETGILTGATSSTMINSGSVVIGTIAGNGTTVAGYFNNCLRNKGTLTNTATGVLILDRGAFYGILHETGVFQNTGQIKIGSIAPLPASLNGQTAPVGISNLAPSSNSAGGDIRIDGGSTGIRNFNSLTNTAQITLGGTTTLTTGIDNSKVTSVTSINGQFVNDAGGIIRIDQVLTGLSNNGGVFSNSATLIIGATPTVSNICILNYAGGSFTNAVTGLVDLHISGTSSDALANATSSAGMTTFANSGTLVIGRAVSTTYSFGINNEASFTNTATGLIRVDGTNFGIYNGIPTSSSAVFANNGTIRLAFQETTGQPGSGIWNLDKFSNQSGGKIYIDGYLGPGLLNSIKGEPLASRTTGTANFQNVGLIQIGASVQNGLAGILNNQQFSNNTGGFIQIDRTGQEGISNTNSGTLTASFTNNATISIGTSASIGTDGLFNTGTFANGSCATLTVFDNLANGSSFTNSGLFTLRTSQLHSNTGTLTNNGILEYPPGNPIPNVTNNKLIAAPVSSCSPSFIPALQLGGNNNQLTVGTTWYSDQALTQIAGTYNQSTNTFAPINKTPGSSQVVYFSVLDNASGCSKTVSVSTTLNATLLVVNIAANPSLTIATGQSTTLTASSGAPAGATTYQWSTGASTPSISINTAGTYSVTGTTGGCSSVTSVVVSVTCTPVYVTQTGAGSQNGSSWSNAYAGTSLQTAINQAATCVGIGSVWVAAGTYKPTTTNDRDGTFTMRPNVAIYGGFVGNETSLSQRPAISVTVPSSTTLSADIANNVNVSAYNLFRNGNNLTNTAVLDGFVLTFALANNTGAQAGKAVGGAMYNEAVGGVCSPTIRNCWFMNNYALTGGGALYNYASNGGDASPILENCRFQNNIVQNGSGGAIYNRAQSASGQLNYNTKSSPKILNCLFVNNVASSGNATSDGGGALYNYAYGGTASPIITGSSFQNNSATIRGGAICTNGSDDGAGSYTGTAKPVLINCSFQGNSAPVGQGSVMANIHINSATSTNATATLVNCIVFNNNGSVPFANTSGATVSLSYSLYEPGVDSQSGNTTGTGTISTNVSPFASTTGTQLSTGSAAINAGNPASTTATLGTSVDLGGNPRIVDGRIDMGAYEYPISACQGPITTVKAGSWDDPTVWSCGAVPVLTDVVQLNHAVSLPGSYIAQVKTLRYGAGGKLTYQTGAQVRLGF